ncbi:MAG: methyl-accepting chemotaxis protein [Spirochaetales bacterium]|nr:methyl-accepting chemotaxis protein [Spirochaetales bacterium]
MIKKTRKEHSSPTLVMILAVSFFSLSVLILLISGGIQLMVYSRSQRESIAGKLKTNAIEASNVVSNFIKEKVGVFKAVSSSINLRGIPEKAGEQILEGVLGLHPEIRHIIFITPEGSIRSSASRLSHSMMMEFYSGITDEYQKIKKELVYISAVYIDSVTSEPEMFIGVHDTTLSGEIRGSLVVEINLKFMWDLMSGIKVGRTGYAFVVDKQGTLIAFRDPSRVLRGESIANLNPVRQFIENSDIGSIGSSTYSGIMDKEVLGLYIPLITPDWAVVAEMPLNEANEEITANIFIVVAITIGIALFAGFIGMFLARKIAIPLVNLTKTAVRITEGDTKLIATIEGSKEVVRLAKAFNSMTAELRNKAEGFKRVNDILSEVILKAKEMISNLNSASKEIEAASQEQTTGANQQASGITEVNATLQELTINAKQITTNVSELVYSSEEVIKLLKESEKRLLESVTQLEDAGMISKANTTQIQELGKRSVIINEMVELIKDVANKTNILSINAAIEASRSGEVSVGFSVVAAEIRELSRETILSAKKAEVAAREIREFLDSIIMSSEDESTKVVKSSVAGKDIFNNIGTIVAKINNNYSFTQKIDVSIKQQENSSIQAAETMRQMAEIARQSAETARQTFEAAKNIVFLGEELNSIVTKFDTGESGIEYQGE